MNDTPVLGESDRRLSELFETLVSIDDDSYPPFRWQKRLLKRLLKESIPEIVDIPTGLGKTSVMALWLIALAEGARLPRRLVYVVDRRAVVDQATRYAERLRANLPRHMASPLGVDEVSGGLPISTLRGGFADNRNWLEDPSKPAIVVGTVDMIGSRLLFEGYGVSRRMRPYQAGLLGVDALVLLDEAHLCPPFEAMLRQVVEHQAKASTFNDTGEWSMPPFRLMSLSATGRQTTEIPSSKVLKLDELDREEAEVRRRLYAKKHLCIEQLDDIAALPAEMAHRAVALSRDGESCFRVIVFCDRRRDALDVKRRVEKHFNGTGRARNASDSFHLELLVGERRIWERKDLERWLEEQGFLGEARTPAERPTFLVATSAGEVGVDLNADHMVCDLVAYERMVQRLGRVNRRGSDSRQAMIDVFWALPSLKANANKAAKDRHASQLEELNNRKAALMLLPDGDNGRQDASPSACGGLRAIHADIIHEAITRPPLYPALTRPLLDAWSMTSLSQHEGRPEVAPWLRGWEDDDEQQTEVVWRKHLPYERRVNGERPASPDAITNFFRNAPIQASEKLEADSKRVFEWLLKRTTKIKKSEDEAEPATDSNFMLIDGDIAAIVLDRSGECLGSAKLGDLGYLAAPKSLMSKPKQAKRDREKDKWIKRLLPGATLIVDARMGGLSGGMLDAAENAVVSTADAGEAWRQAAEDPNAEVPRPLIKFRVEEVVATGEEEEGLQPPIAEEGWRHVRTHETVFSDGRATRGLAILNWHDAAADEDAKAFLSRPQLLREHAAQTADCARRITERLDLPNWLVEAVIVAARLHDDGKAASRWQRAMNAPEDWLNHPYAKTEGGGNPRLLERYRHEFGSLLKAERADIPDKTRDLILHLVAAHHGYSRPLIRHEGCDEGPPSQMEAKAGEAALRFARLQRRYGPWGLAWLEALVRAADQSASREWSMGKAKDKGG